MSRLSICIALAAMAVVSGAACVLPSYEGEGGAGGAGPGGLTTGSTNPASNGSKSSAGTEASSGVGTSTGTDATTGTEATTGTSVASSSGSDVASSSGSDVASSSSSGTPCLLALPACGNVEAYDFKDQPGLEERFDVDQPDAKAMGGKLKLDPAGPQGTEAVLKAKEDAEFAGDCAIWITLATTNADGTSGFGLGDGSLLGAQLRVARDGEQLVSYAPSGAPASVPFAEDEMRYLRIRVIAGEAYFDYAADKSCWTQLSGPHDRNGDKPTMFHTGAGNAQLDDYCID